MYYVILCNDWCSAVPKNWVNLEKETVLWPSKDVPIRSAIIKSIPPNNNWNIIKYRRVTGPFDD